MGGTFCAFLMLTLCEHEREQLYIVIKQMDMLTDHECFLIVIGRNVSG